MATNEDIVRRLGKLQTVLLTSGLQQRDQPLYQVINQLIKAVIDSSSDTIAATGGSGGGGGGLSSFTYITVGNELANLPNSSQLVAGDNVSFDTSTFGQLRIDVILDFIIDATFLTAEDESADFPSSRQLIAGTGITFDDSVANERTISSTGGGIPDYYDSPLSDGDLTAAELIFADGECIICVCPNP